MVTFLLLICISAFILLYLWRANQQKGSANLPPGPCGLPIVGHLLFLGPSLHLTLMKWAKIYGPIFSLKFASLPVVVLSDIKLIKKAYNIKSLSGRAKIKNWVMASELKGLIMSDGPRQEEQRHFAITTLNQFGVGKTTHNDRLQEEISIFLDNLKNKIKAKERSYQDKVTAKGIIKVANLFRIPVINSIYREVIGERFEEEDPTVVRLLQIMESALESMSSILAQMTFLSSWLATVLCYFGVNSAVNSWRSIHEYMNERIQLTKIDYLPGQPKHFTHAYFDRVAQTTDPKSGFYPLRREQSITTGDIFIASLESTTKTMDWLLLYVARNPTVQTKLQAEIDSVIGYKVGNTPSLSHRLKMPYAVAVINELLRISSFAPLSFHCALEDVHIYGYTIPKGTVVIGNQYAVHYDPNVWLEPNKFLPERFLANGEGKAKNVASDIIPFGVGKRSCIGKGFARDALFLFATSFFQKFSISCTETIPSLDVTCGLTLSPKHSFEVYISER